MYRCYSFIVALTVSLLVGAPSVGLAQVEQWNQKADMMGPRLFFTASAADGQVYVMGGMLAQVLPSMHAYNPIHRRMDGTREHADSTRRNV